MKVIKGVVYTNTHVGLLPGCMKWDNNRGVRTGDIYGVFNSEDEMKATSYKDQFGNGRFTAIQDAIELEDGTWEIVGVPFKVHGEPFYDTTIPCRMIVEDIHPDPGFSERIKSIEVDYLERDALHKKIFGRLPPDSKKYATSIYINEDAEQVRELLEEQEDTKEIKDAN